MNIWYWILCYALPAGVAIYLTSTQTLPRNKMLTMHGGILVSIFILSAVGGRLHIEFQTLYVLLAVTSLIATISFLSWLPGFGYTLSSVIQEYCLLLAGLLLVPVGGVWIAAFATALIYAVAHQMESSNWRWKFPLMLVWGMVSIFLYAWLQQPLLNIALHASIGAALIRVGLLYPNHAKIK